MTTSTLSATTAPSAVSVHQLHAEFLDILPRIETHARIHFRHLRCPGRRDDAVAETIAVAWKWYRRIREQGRDAHDFVMTLADYAVRHVRSGRRLCRSETARDVLSQRAQRQKGFRVEPLPHSVRRGQETLYADPHGQDRTDTYEERLRDNTQTPVPDQAAFRIEFPLWLERLSPRNRQIAEDMALDLGTGELAARHKVTAGRISQLRREFQASWQNFCGETTC